MRRRDFVTLLGGAAAWPLTASAQQSAMPVVGFLRRTSATVSSDLVAALRRGLTQAGYTEGQNLAIEYRWAENQGERLPGLVADLVRRQCTVIIAGGDAVAHAAKAATASIPIVFATSEEAWRAPPTLLLFAFKNAGDVAGRSGPRVGARSILFAGEALDIARARYHTNSGSGSKEGRLDHRRTRARAPSRGASAPPRNVPDSCPGRPYWHRVSAAPTQRAHLTMAPGAPPAP